MIPGVAWYKEWFGQEYLELYAHRDEGEAERHIDFVAARFAGERPRAVLDLACGAGRHTGALRRSGYRALGVDLSLTLLTESPELPRVAGDMRCLPFADATFDWVLNFFTSFGYFESERENFRILEEIVRVMRPGGRFLIDLFNIDRVLATLEPRETRDMNGRRVEIERWYDARSRRINKQIRVHASDRPTRSYLESVRAYRLDEVSNGLEWAGLRLDETHGGFGDEEFGPNSERLILVGSKPE
jgi:SAM-dependent methyltransferase